MMTIIQAFLFAALLVVVTTSDVNDRYYPRYHLAPPYGWMNDPNGFSVFKNEYHLFYQYNPNSSLEPGIAHWGHAKSSDLFHWIHLPIAMYPDKDYDKTGVFSGSALVEDDVMYLYYTGNVNYEDKTPDHEQHQALATSTDGVKVTKYETNPIIVGEEHQPDFRDPKVWKHENSYYMVLGNSFQNSTLGRVLLYKSSDKINWKQVSILNESNGTLGYMFECPDFFPLGDKYILLFSPQGIEPQGDKYRNLYQTGYIVGDFDYTTNSFTPVSEFKELDHGHDFYATQTIEDGSGRRIMIAWFDMWERNYPERPDGFTGFMTIPRVLSLDSNYNIIQKPVEEISKVRDSVLRTGSASKGESITLSDKAGEVLVKAPTGKDIEVIIEGQNSTVSIQYDSKKGKITLNRSGEDGVRRTEWKPKDEFVWDIYIDASSVELFCGSGEVTFSSRFFPIGDVTVRLGDSNVDLFEVTTISRAVPKGGEDSNAKK